MSDASTPAPTRGCILILTQDPEPTPRPEGDPPRSGLEIDPGLTGALAEAGVALDVGLVAVEGDADGMVSIHSLLPGTTADRPWSSLEQLGIPEPEGSEPDAAAVSSSQGPGAGWKYAHRHLVQWLGRNAESAPPIVVLHGIENAPDGGFEHAARSLQVLATRRGNVAIVRSPAPGGESPIDADLGGLIWTVLDRSENLTPLRGGSPALEARALTLPKKGNSEAEWEDAFEVSVDHGRGVVCDGASEGIYVKLWASMLARGFIEAEADLDDPAAFAAWVGGCRKEWKTGINYGSLDYFKQTKVNRTGGAATFLGWELVVGESDAAPETAFRWRAQAVGDACLFQIRDGRLLASFPCIGPDDFGFAPALLRTLVVGAGPTPVLARGDCQAGDVFVLATDAVAQALLRSVVEGDPPRWERYWELDPDAWRAEIEELRADGRIVNDDCTLLLVRIGTGPRATEEPE